MKVGGGFLLTKIFNHFEGVWGLKDRGGFKVKSCNKFYNKFLQSTDISMTFEDLMIIKFFMKILRGYNENFNMFLCLITLFLVFQL